MKQQIGIIILGFYSDKVLFEYDKRSEQYILPRVDLIFRNQPEEIIGAYFQKKLRVLPDNLEIIGIYEDGPEEKLYLVYLASLGDKNYLETLKYKTAIWLGLDKAAKKLDEISRGVLQRFDQKIFKINDNISSVINSNDKYILYTDGGSRGNPGHSGIGYAIYNSSGDIIQEGCEYIGIAVSGVAEYQAVLRGMEVAINLGIKNLEVRVDNLMIAKQMNGTYQVKNRELWPIHERIMALSVKIQQVKFVHVKREFNEIADRLVNEALDGYLTNA